MALKCDYVLGDTLLIITLNKQTVASKPSKLNKENSQKKNTFPFSQPRRHMTDETLTLKRERMKY